MGINRKILVVLWMTLMGGGMVLGQGPHTALDYIDPTIGNVAPLLNTNRPVVHLPNQVVRVFPRRQDHLDMQITDFPTMVTNIITPQMVFGVKPSIGEVTDTGWYRRLNYDHDFEVTRPWYYSVRLTDDQVLTEYTAGEKTGIYRFHFPAGVQKNLLFSHYYENGEYQVQGKVITGTEKVNDAIHSQEGQVYLYGEVSGGARSGIKKGEGAQSGIKEGEKDWGKYTVGGRPEAPKKVNGQRAWFSFDAGVGGGAGKGGVAGGGTGSGAGADGAVEFRYAISFISIDQAKKNYERELTGISFDQLKNKGEAAWQKAIGRIKVEGGTEAQRRTFYTALYRCYARMVDMSEGGRYFSGWDKKVHVDKRPFYTDDYTWGNYIALHPLRVILDPKKEADMLQAYVRMYEQEGWMPEYPRPFGDRPGMFAFHSSVLFLDAYRKGIRGFDVEKAFEGMVKNEEQATLLPFRNGPRGDLEKFYDKNGYYPGLRPDEEEADSFASLKRGQVRSSVAVTLGDSYDSWAVSELAKELGKGDIHDRYAPRAQNYKNLWWDKYQLFMPKDGQGKWIEIDPKYDGGNNGFAYYNENNGWTYKWNVQQDLKGLRELAGGADKMEQQLDQLFREGLDRGKPQFWAKFPNETGMIGQMGMGNQVSFFIPYLFNYTHAPWKTQKYTRLILDTWFQDNVFGVPGDEDGGSMSSFVVFSAMGFFPVVPGIPRYTITSPLFTKVSIDLSNGKKFTLVANKCSRTNKYIQSATLNGKPLRSLSFSHEELMNGGTLVLEMGEGTDARWEMEN